MSTITPKYQYPAYGENPVPPKKAPAPKPTTPPPSKYKYPAYGESPATPPKKTLPKDIQLLPIRPGDPPAKTIPLGGPGTAKGSSLDTVV